MYLHLDHHSGEPIYRQIVEAIKYQIASGRLPLDHKLPSIRVLAEELKINPRTVVKAYEELQNSGLVIMRHGQGVFVTSSQVSMPQSARQKAIADMAQRMLSEAIRLGAGKAEMLRIIEAEINKMDTEP